MTRPVSGPPARAPLHPYATLDSTETLREIARRLRHGICVTTPDGEFLDANAAFLELVGVATLDELRGYRVGDIVVDPERRDRELAAFVADDAGVSVCEFEHWIIRPDGELRAVLETAYVFRDADAAFHHAILVDVTRRKELERQLIELSMRDALTGCYNRRYLDDVGRSLNARPGAEWGCIFIDIDHFKQYNDHYGHDAGDEALIRMSRFLMRELRAENAVVRLGGDEFLAVLVGADAADTGAVARRLEVAASRAAPVPFSLGWASRVGAERFDQTVGRADQNLLAVRVLDRSPERQRRVDEWVQRVEERAKKRGPRA